MKKTFELENTPIDVLATPAVDQVVSVTDDIIIILQKNMLFPVFAVEERHIS